MPPAAGWPPRCRAARPSICLRPARRPGRTAWSAGWNSRGGAAACVCHVPGRGPRGAPDERKEDDQRQYVTKVHTVIPGCCLFSGADLSRLCRPAKCGLVSADSSAHLERPHAGRERPAAQRLYTSQRVGGRSLSVRSASTPASRRRRRGRARPAPPATGGSAAACP